MKKYLALILPLFLISCDNDDSSKSNDSESVLAGGKTTIFSSGPDAFALPAANLETDNVNRHFLADAAFGQQFVTAPSEQFGGIGPLYNQNSCESCHVRNGRGTIPEFDGDPNSGLLLRISVPGSGTNGSIIPVPGFGGQLQNKAIFDVVPEGKITKTEVEKIVNYLDGSSATLKQPTYGIAESYIPLPENVLISPRVAPPVFGLGLLEAIPENTLLALADESDSNGDGISGKPNQVWDVLTQQINIGRFGWKAEEPTVNQQSAGAANNDMGLTNNFFTTEHCDGQPNCTEGLQSTTDLDDETTLLMGFYAQTLGVPASRNHNKSEVLKGKALFTQLNCSGCHTPQFTTGTHVIAELSNQVIFPYTDLLLHDLGEGLADNRPTFQANGKEWRTSPLWGIGLTKV
ncbi:thiol oxidoreductase, partial [bacterium]|nr:thiol oxidoreductase [bacterium]